MPLLECAALAMAMVPSTTGVTAATAATAASAATAAAAPVATTATAATAATATTALGSLGEAIFALVGMAVAIYKVVEVEETARMAVAHRSVSCRITPIRKGQDALISSPDARITEGALARFKRSFFGSWFGFASASLHIGLKLYSISFCCICI